MKRLQTNIIMLLVVFGLITTLCTSVSAAEFGSITIQAFDPEDTSKPIPGIECTVYYVAALSEDNTSHFVVDPLFAGYTGRLEYTTSSECAEGAKELYSYTKTAGIKGITISTNSEGCAIFGNLKKGLYLVAQTGSKTKEYKDFAPFLVELPLYDNNEYLYNIEVFPKFESNPPEKPTPTPTPTIPIDDPDTPAGPIPQTGMLMWPIPVMAVIGGGFIITGGVSVAISKIKGKTKKEE